MDYSDESTFIDSEEDEIFLTSRMPDHLKQAYAESDTSPTETPIPDRSLEDITTGFESVALGDHSHAGNIPIEDLANSPVMKSWQGGSNEPASTAEKDMLLLALKQRFEKHKVDLPPLCDLNLDDTTAENDSCAGDFQDRYDKSVEFVVNCSMPQLIDSGIDESDMLPSKLHTKSTEKTKDLDSTAKFLELEKSCLTPSKPDDDCRECLSELSSDDLSTVSADADGGFLTTLTNLALIHPTLERDSFAMSPFPAAKPYPDYGTIPESEADCIESPSVLDESVGEHCSDDSAAEVPLNSTFEEIQLLEAFGVHYMLSAEKDLIKSGLTNSMNVSLSKDQKNILDSFTEPSTSTKSGVSRDISKAFESSNATLAIASPTVHDKTKSDGCSTSAQDFQFPKPLSTVSGSHSKTKYRHQTTPMKQVSPNTPATEKAFATKSGKFFGSSPVKPSLLAPRTKFFSGSPLNNPSRENPKSRLNVPVSGLKTMADLKKIQSPIGHYIHDSPVPSLVARNRTPFAGLQKNNKCLTVETPEKKISENIDFNNVALPPQKSYQSTSSLKKMTPSKTRLPLLSGKTKQLVSTPKAMVIKHTGRVKASDLPSNSPLSKMPAKIDDSCLAEKTLDAEVSVVVAKEATKTSSIK